MSAGNYGNHFLGIPPTVFPSGTLRLLLYFCEEDFPLLAEACREVSDPNVRKRGVICAVTPILSWLLLILPCVQGVYYTFKHGMFRVSGSCIFLSNMRQLSLHGSTIHVYWCYTVFTKKCIITHASVKKKISELLFFKGINWKDNS